VLQLIELQIKVYRTLKDSTGQQEQQAQRKIRHYRTRVQPQTLLRPCLGVLKAYREQRKANSSDTNRVAVYHKPLVGAALALALRIILIKDPADTSESQ
jgi:hypothetical protein